MKKTLLFLLFISLAGANILYSQSLTRADFLSVLIPKHSASGGTTRLPVVFRATVQNLSAYTTYRYYVQAAKFSDMGSTNTGAGNPLFMNPDSASFAYTTSPSISTAGGYSIFRTNASGAYTGWFAFVNTGNARFTGGNYISPSIAIADSVGTIVARRALSDSIHIISFGTGAADTSGTGVWAKFSGTAKNLILLYDNTTGTDKPLSISYLESEGVSIASSVQFYIDSVNGNNGRWGTIIPNVNANGIQRVEQRSLSDGSVVSYLTSANGTWNGISTVNPAGGTTPLRLDSLIAGPTKTLAGTVSTRKFVLEQNYPNPFNPTTIIRYHVPQNSFVTIKVYNALGNEVATLVNQEMSAGDHETLFGINQAKNLSSGLYFYKLTAGGYSAVHKMVLLK